MKEVRAMAGKWINNNRYTGFPAPAFALPDAQGRIYRLQDYAGNWLLLVFHRHLG
jgi:peroxiredoxin